MGAPTPAGVLPVLAVPFHPAGRLDLEGFEVICDHVFRSGVDGALLFGIASEFYKLSDSERREVRRRFLAVAADHQPVTTMVSVTAHATFLAVEEARAAVADGAQALNILPPYFLAPSPADINAHLDAVLGAVDVPVVVQYAPAQTGTSLTAEDLRALARTHANLSTVKVESQPPGRFVTELAAETPALAGIVGYAGLHLPDAVRRGAVGVQPGCSFAELYVRLWRHHRDGRDEAFKDLHRRMLPYLVAWMQHVELIIQVEKTILARRGIIASDHCRRPGWDLDGEELAVIDRFLEEFAAELTPAETARDVGR
jgi:dihydrodipicolinate synthase/N-acetylneuraminate lyase